MSKDLLEILIEKYKLTPKGRGSSQILRLLNLNKNNLQYLLIEKTKFLDEYYHDISIEQRLYHVWFNDYDIKKCHICNNPLKYSGKFSMYDNISGKNYHKTCGNDTCRKIQNTEATKNAIFEKYGVNNISKLDSIKNKKVKTHLKNYGTEQPFQSEHFKQKTKETSLKKYGTKHHLQNKEQLSKQNSTCFEKYGTKYAIQNKDVKEKALKTMVDKYGVEYPLQSDIIKENTKQTNLKKYYCEWQFQTDNFKEKSKETHIKKYGVEYSSQLDSHKNGYRWYNYILPSGKEVKIQGYEDKFLDEYFNSGGLESNIIIEKCDISSKIGKIWYNTQDGKKHRYYPDIYLIEEHKIIEVKSDYTASNNIEINELKRQACLDKGLNFEYKIY